MVRTFTGADVQLVALYPTGTIRLFGIGDLTELICDEPDELDVIPGAVYVRNDDALTLAEFTTDLIAGTASATVSDNGTTIAHASGRTA